jgi:quinol-cytochrome oxidoreductase complex cytochrome b subunit
MARIQSIHLAVLAFVVMSTALLGYSPPAHAWGRIGHRVISRFAEQQLTDKAKAGIAALLSPGESLADASLWADEHRRELPKTAPRHYVDVPLDEERYYPKWSADDAKKGCLVDKINEF